MPKRDSITHPARDPVHPWDQQPDESDAAYSAFLVYRDKGLARSLNGVGPAIHPGGGRRKRGANGRINEWSSRYKWPSRAHAWDVKEADRIMDEERELIRLDMAKALGRKREYREKNDELGRLIRAKIEKGIKAKTLSPKDVRELALATDRLVSVQEGAFKHLPVDTIGGAPADPNLARELERYTVEIYLKRTVPVTVTDQHESDDTDT
jgi:hypothetical protein